MLRIALVTNELPPYRLPLFRMLAAAPGIELQVLFCSRREPNRQWELPPLEFEHVFLNEHIFSVGGRYIHSNPEVIPALRRFGPHVIITGGFNPTHLYAFAYARWHRVPHIAMTDGTDRSEHGLSALHRQVRRFVYRRSHAFVAASEGGIRLYRRYGVPPEACFRSPLCVDNTAFAPLPGAARARSLDLLFCGRLEEVKGPLFALEVAAETARRLGRRVSIAFVGNGSQEQAIRSGAERYRDLIAPSFHGFLSHAQLPEFYRAARVFLFPTSGDAWGVVANEACAAGVPVIVSPHAGAAGELVVDGWNGFVCELDRRPWAQHASMLLSQQEAWQRFSSNALRAAAGYEYANAAAALIAACRHAVAGAPRLLAKAGRESEEARDESARKKTRGACHRGSNPHQEEGRRRGS
jgi:glycosyltransferase involved in cell wall biosynthesis